MNTRVLLDMLQIKEMRLKQELEINLVRQEQVRKWIQEDWQPSAEFLEWLEARGEIAA